jgi:hypothetical protein
MTQLNESFSNSVPLRHVRSFGAFHVYKRQANATAVYFLQIGGQIKHTGSKKYISGRFMSYVRSSIARNLRGKSLEQLKEMQA